MNDGYGWYSQLIKPSWAPPGWVFGPVWAVLYVIIAVTFGAVFYKAFTKRLPWKSALPFALNLVFNFAFTPVQFGLRNNYLAALDILLVLATLIWGGASAPTERDPVLLTEMKPLRSVGARQQKFLLWVVALESTRRIQ